jgi:hypothetical protein
MFIVGFLIGLALAAAKFQNIDQFLTQALTAPLFGVTFAGLAVAFRSMTAALAEVDEEARIAPKLDIARVPRRRRSLLWTFLLGTALGAIAVVAILFGRGGHSLFEGAMALLILPPLAGCGMIVTVAIGGAVMEFIQYLRRAIRKAARSEEHYRGDAGGTGKID